MSHPDRYIPGVPCWVDTTQPDPVAAAAFYGGLFGWELEETMPPGSPGSYRVARLGGGDVAAVSSQPEGGPSAAAWNTYVWVTDADETADKVRDRRRRRPERALRRRGRGPDGGLRRPGRGRVLRVAGAGAPRRRGGQRARLAELQRPRTRDLDGARSFYGAVFGWEVLDLGASFAWALPGYGDFLEQRTPGTRENMAADGRP